MRVNGVNPGSSPELNVFKMQDAKGKGTGKSTGYTGDPGKNEREITREEVEKAVNQINSTIRAYYTELHFELHEKSGEMMVKVINKETDTIIREIPPEKILDMVAYFKRILGIIVDKMI